jgi:hypothetical protein
MFLFLMQNYKKTYLIRGANFGLFFLIIKFFLCFI